MSVAPPSDLKSWSKKNLAREVQRLRAVLREHAERPGSDPREAATRDATIDIAGDPNAAGGSLLDLRSAVLLRGIDVVLVDTKQDDPVAMMMTLSGRINYASDEIEHVYVFGPDGAAALMTQLVQLAKRASGLVPHGQRFAAEFKVAVEERMADA